MELGFFHIDSARGGDSAHCISIPANPKKQANGGEGLRMGRLFEILLFDSPIRMDTMDHQVDPYQRRICLVYIWGLSVDDS
ncbi:hypothetical protein DTO013E5_3715 [Penicillium roqueforti]|nr:hypothetical protein DTO012A1_8902 [Penicillium roqueforti]KAI2752402.1 hypothetical protein DTO013F2_3205 [Penicillium roqueforti]KAI3213802.1 hypothetical protein DTO013E5_3715 [Penicillium roqueforti]